MESGEVPRRTKELCAALGAALTFCTPELVAHRKHAREAGASAAMLNDLWESARSEWYSEAEKAALAATVALTREPRALPEAVWSQLRAHYTDAQIVELLCAIGLQNYVSRVQNALAADHAV